MKPLLLLISLGRDPFWREKLFRYVLKPEVNLTIDITNDNLCRVFLFVCPRVNLMIGNREFIPSKVWPVNEVIKLKYECHSMHAVYSRNLSNITQQLSACYYYPHHRKCLFNPFIRGVLRKQWHSFKQNLKLSLQAGGSVTLCNLD